MTKTAKPITKEEAVSILASALSYCQQSGLPVMAQQNDAGALLLTLPGVTVTVQDGRAVFALASDGTPQAACDGTPAESDGIMAGNAGTPAPGDSTPQAVTA